MGSVSSETPAMATNPKYIFFTDFDGTVTTADSNDYMTDNIGYGLEKRVQGNKDVLHGLVHFRDSFQDMMDSIDAPFDQCIELLKQHITLDPGFKEFYAWSRENNVPIVILSGGMQPVIRALLDNLLGKGLWDIQVVSNDVAPREGKGGINEKGGWRINFHDDSIHGHDKSIEIRKYSSLPARPIMFYAGDGVSDLSAAKETDLLFAKADKGKSSHTRGRSGSWPVEIRLRTFEYFFFTDAASQQISSSTARRRKSPLSPSATGPPFCRRARTLIPGRSPFRRLPGAEFKRATCL